MKKLSIGIQNFSDLIQENYVYVDKTKHIYDMISSGKYYQTIFYVLLKIVGADIIVEQPTNIGRIDAAIQTKK